MELNIQLYLSQNKIDLLRKVNKAIESNENFNLTSADMHENLKFILNKPFNRKYVKHFRSEVNFVNICLL